MLKMGCGFFILLIGMANVVWVAYNLLIRRQPEFKLPIVPVFFTVGALYVGVKWLVSGWESFQTPSRPKKRKKKRRRQEPVWEDEDD